MGKLWSSILFGFVVKLFFSFFSFLRFSNSKVFLRDVTLDSRGQSRVHCVFLVVKERERERDGDKEGVREGEKEREGWRKRGR